MQRLAPIQRAIAIARVARVASAVALVGVFGCGGPGRGAQGPAGARVPGAAGRFYDVAEGPCSKLGIAAVGDRTFVVFGDAGYALRDWDVGERLPARESIAEIRADAAYDNPAIREGLPEGLSGYVDGDLALGGAFPRAAWLLRTESTYAPRKAGALFERRSEAYQWMGDAWVPSDARDVHELPSGVGARLPVLDTAAWCDGKSWGGDAPLHLEGEGALHFVRLASSVAATGDALVAGRCQDQSRINRRDVGIVVGHAAPGAAAWRLHVAPEVTNIDAIVNVRLFARGGADAYMVAYEPFQPVDARPPYVAHFDGARWTPLDTPIPSSTMGIAGAADGTLWIAAGHDLWRRDAGGAWSKVALPPLRFARPARPPSLRVTGVHVGAAGDVWVEADYRVKTGGHDDVRASALFRSRPLARPLYCDARKPRALALVAVDAVDADDAGHVGEGDGDGQDDAARAVSSGAGE